MNDDDVFPIGKLRRPGLPSAPISYDPLHGIRVNGEQVPPTPETAAEFLKRQVAWIRLHPRAKKRSAPMAVREFIAAWRRRG